MYSWSLQDHCDDVSFNQNKDSQTLAQFQQAQERLIANFGVEVNVIDTELKQKDETDELKTEMYPVKKTSSMVPTNIVTLSTSLVLAGFINSNFEM